MGGITMHLKKGKIFGFLLLLILATTIFFIFGGMDMFSRKSSANFSEIIKQDNIDNLSLKIYYMSPYMLTLRPLNVDDLINMSEVHKVVVSGSSLKEHINILNQISNADFIPVKNKSCINARLYYVFETKKNGKVFDVALWGNENSVFVNGVEVKGIDAFYDVVIPFLPEDIVKELKKYLGKTE